MGPPQGRAEGEENLPGPAAHTPPNASQEGRPCRRVEKLGRGLRAVHASVAITALKKQDVKLWWCPGCAGARPWGSVLQVSDEGPAAQLTPLLLHYCPSSSGGRAEVISSCKVTQSALLGDGVGHCLCHLQRIFWEMRRSLLPGTGPILDTQALETLTVQTTSTSSHYISSSHQRRSLFLQPALLRSNPDKSLQKLLFKVHEEKNAAFRRLWLSEPLCRAPPPFTGGRYCGGLCVWWDSCLRVLPNWHWELPN